MLEEAVEAVAAGFRSSSTAGSGAASTSRSRWRSAPTRSWSAGLRSGGWRPAARRAPGGARTAQRGARARAGALRLRVAGRARPRTPSSPAAARPQSGGRPTRTASAPSARAIATSMPRPMPPSTRTVPGQRSLRPSPGARRRWPTARSSWRPPWLETITPAAPLCTARFASSAVRRPLTRSGRS